MDADVESSYHDYEYGCSEYLVYIGCRESIQHMFCSESRRGDAQRVVLGEGISDTRIPRELAVTGKTEDFFVQTVIK